MFSTIKSPILVNTFSSYIISPLTTPSTKALKYSSAFASSTLVTPYSSFNLFSTTSNSYFEKKF